eukprot:gene5828-9032_t
MAESIDDKFGTMVLFVEVVVVEKLQNNSPSLPGTIPPLSCTRPPPPRPPPPHPYEEFWECHRNTPHTRTTAARDGRTSHARTTIAGTVYLSD